MSIILTKPMIAGVVVLPTLHPFLQVILTIIMIGYFVSIQKVNIVDKNYNGSWWLFFKSIPKYFKKK